MSGNSDSRTLMEIRRELIDSVDEELEMELDDEREAEFAELLAHKAARDTIDRKLYFNELFRLQGELVKLQDWVVHQRLKVVVIFEGRDAAGKGGVIKRITQRLNPRVCRVAALPAPSERERTQWYFQRYVAHLPAARRNRAVRPLLVQPRRRRARHGLLHRGRSARSSSAPCRSSSGCWCAPASS